MKDFASIRKTYQPLIENYLTEFLNAARMDGHGAFCSQMTAYHLGTGGKRLRALIPLYIFAVCDHVPDDAIALGAAVEMIHNATLVHDDLQDGDEMRRNRQTVWKKYSGVQAINCGDAMFHYAIRLLARLDCEPAKRVRLMDRAALATINVIEGQAQEFLMKEEKFPGVARYVDVVRGKTSGLFALPIVGAMEALGMETRACSLAEEASMDLGMLFQIQDDLLDIYGKGKKGRDKAATDIAEGKISMLVAHVYEKGTSKEKEALAAILKKPRLETTDGDVNRAIEIFESSDAKGAAVRFIREIQQKTAENEGLKSVPEIRQALLELAELFLEPVNELL